MVLIIVAAVFIVFVAAAIIKTLLWLGLIVLIAAAVGVAFGALRFGHRPARRYPGSRR